MQVGPRLRLLAADGAGGSVGLDTPVLTRECALPMGWRGLIIVLKLRKPVQVGQRDTQMRGV